MTSFESWALCAYKQYSVIELGDDDVPWPSALPMLIIHLSSSFGDRVRVYLERGTEFSSPSPTSTTSREEVRGGRREARWSSSKREMTERHGEQVVEMPDE